MGAPWRMIPNYLPPWQYYLPTKRGAGLKPSALIAMVHDLREMLRVAAGKNPQPTAAILMGAHFSPRPKAVSGRAMMGPSVRKADKVHIAVDTLGHLLALHVTPANEQECAQGRELAAQVQEATDQSVTLA